MNQIEARHELQHNEQTYWMRNVITDNRDEIGLNPAWVIESGMCCPRDLPTQEAIAIWDAEVHYGRLQFRCDLPKPLLLWLVIHELYELLMWETADIFMIATVRARLNRQFTRHLQDSYRAARNRQIELLVFRHLGYRRPGHLMEDTLPSEPMPLYVEERKEA
jgi:hypothetical protein